MRKLILTRRMFLAGAAATGLIPAVSFTTPTAPALEPPIKSYPAELAEIYFVGDGPVTTHSFMMKPSPETRLAVNGVIMPSVEGLELTFHRSAVYASEHHFLPLLMDHSLECLAMCDPKLMSLMYAGDSIKVSIIPAGSTYLYSGNFLMTQFQPRETR